MGVAVVTFAIMEPFRIQTMLQNNTRKITIGRRSTAKDNVFNGSEGPPLMRIAGCLDPSVDLPAGHENALTAGTPKHRAAHNYWEATDCK